jgi:hypothetical protein
LLECGQANLGGQAGFDHVDVERIDARLYNEPVALRHDVKDRRTGSDHRAYREKAQIYDLPGNRRSNVDAAQYVFGGTKVFFGRGEFRLDLFELLRDLRGEAVLEIDDLQLGLADRLLGARDLRNVLAAAARQLCRLAPKGEQPRLPLQSLAEE